MSHKTFVVSRCFVFIFLFKLFGCCSSSHDIFDGVVAVRAVRGASHVSISEDTGSALKCIIGHCIQGRLWRFPFLLSGSRRWDHRTSLHRWQPRLKVSRSRGAYRLLARCEILPCMLFSACARSFITQRDGMSLLSHQRQGREGKGRDGGGRQQFGVLLSQVSYSGWFLAQMSNPPSMIYLQSEACDYQE